ncbi:hypothetical protein APHAL10511_008669 [Amanita phalloides]|nr:hypothetical protein APHAL10511_008669 [Amanita phalloides]
MSCPNCVIGGLLPGEPTGITSFQNAYLAAAPSESPSKRAVLLLTDIFGLAYNNPKIIADKLAKDINCDVWVPDYFNGEPIIKPESMAAAPPTGVKASWQTWLNFILLLIPRLFVYYRNRPTVVYTRLKEFIHALKREKEYDTIGAVGYCYGGSQAVLIASSGLVNSIVVCHPGSLTVEQIKAINIPASWVLAEEDFLFPEAIRDQAEAIFASRKAKSEYVDYEFVIYKGTTHGFAGRPDLSHPMVKEAYENAFKQTVDWFRRTL